MGSITPGKILVTGGGGFLGSAIVRQLVKNGGIVRSFSRGFYPELDKLNVEQIQGSIANMADVENACRGIELIFHTAAKAGVWGNYTEYYNTNTIGTLNIIRACEKYGISRLIHTSSPSVIFNGTDMEGVDESFPYPSEYPSHYSATKALAEHAVLRASKNGLRAIILRPHLIWGPGDNHLVPRIIDRYKSLRIVGGGKNRVDTIYIDNAAYAHILASEKLNTHPELSGKIYFISQNGPVFLWDMVNDILNAGGKPPVKKSISISTARNIGTVLEFIYKTFRLKGEPKMTRFVAEELGTSHWFDTTAAKTDLGYQPKISTKEGLRRLKAWLGT